MLNLFGIAEFPAMDIPVAGPVAEGQLAIAQRFSVGSGHPPRFSPEGTAEPGARDVQPSLRDWSPLPTDYPTLKRWAIFKHPSGMNLAAVRSTFEEM